MSKAPALRSRLAAPMLLTTLLSASVAGCFGPSEIKTYRWGGQSVVGRYLVDMGSIRRVAGQIDFQILFLPEPTAKDPRLSMYYVLDNYRMDCEARTSQRRPGGQAHLMFGLPVTMQEKGEATSASIGAGTTWASVRDLVCDGSNDLSPTPLTGTTPAVAKQARARMVAHPVVDPDAAPSKPPS